MGARPYGYTFSSARLHVAWAPRYTRTPFDDTFHIWFSFCDMACLTAHLCFRCPATFQHAVEYVEAPWASRMVAVQCRMLLTTQELYNVLLSPDCSFERSMIDVIGPLLGGAEVAAALLRKQLQAPPLESHT